MKSVAFFEPGEPSVLQVIDRPQPEAGPGEVVVRVAAAAVNPTDLMMRRGQQATAQFTPPFIPGMEFSGRVHSVGKGVAPKPGQPVIGVVNPRRQEGGAYTEFICLPAGQVAVLPETIDLTGAATVPMNALTAMLALEMVGLKPGQALLVTGGAGMLGGSVLQLAERAGLMVVANAAPEDADLVRSLGAKVVLPRDKGMAEAFSAQFPDGADALIDGALIGVQVSKLVRNGGAAIALRSSHPIKDARLRCETVMVTNGMSRPELLQATADHIASGVLRPRIAPGGVFPFAQAAAAHEMAETAKVRGRIVLTFSG